MDIVFVTPEIYPFSRFSELGDVAAALPKALRALGHRVHVVTLLHASIDPTANTLARRLIKLNVPIGAESIPAEVYEARLPSGVQVTFLSAPGMANRPASENEPADHRRFAFLSRGVVEWLRTLPKLPDIVHANDWPTGLVPLFLRLAAETEPALRAVRTVFTVHDVADQGIFPTATLSEIGVPPQFGSPEGLEFYGNASWLKAGILFSDKVTTVSPSYAKEITTPEHGERLDGALRSRGKNLAGIISGVDFAVWNPATDPHLAAHYDAEDCSAKERCKADLVLRAVLAPRPATALLGWLGPLAASRGFDLLLEAAPRLLRQDLQIVVLGTGERSLVEGIQQLAERFPERVSVKTDPDDALLHKAFAGIDFYLAPSRHEPTGLGTLYAMRYGAIPIGRATGGIRDAVLDCDVDLETGTGFLFDHAGADEFYGAVSRALTAFRKGETFARLRRRVMRKDLSWERSGRQYQALYSELVQGAVEAPRTA